MREFIETHWGDLIGLLLLYTGIAIVLWGACAPAMQVASHLGESLVLAAMGVLKLRGNGRNAHSNHAIHETPDSNHESKAPIAGQAN